MRSDSNKIRRHSIRLPGYDYSTPGAYFVTICTTHRDDVFGEVVDGVMALTDAGRIVGDCWNDLPNHYLNLRIDEFTVMPNHVHGIIIITDETLGIVGAGLKPAPTPLNSTKRYGLPEIVRGFKTFSSRRINFARGTSGIPVWQQNYYEHVIRDKRELENTRQYINDNPIKWRDDPDNLVNLQ